MRHTLSVGLQAEENLERRMKDEEAESEDVPTEKGERMLMHLAKHVKAAIQARLNQNISKTGQTQTMRQLISICCPKSQGRAQACTGIVETPG